MGSSEDRNSVNDTFRNHEKRITRVEVKVEKLEALKIDKRLNRVDMVFFALSIGVGFFLWLVGNTKIISAFFEGVK